MGYSILEGLQEGGHVGQGMKGGSDCWTSGAAPISISSSTLMGGPEHPTESLPPSLGFRRPSLAIICAAPSLVTPRCIAWLRACPPFLRVCECGALNSWEYMSFLPYHTLNLAGRAGLVSISSQEAEFPLSFNFIFSLYRFFLKAAPFLFIHQSAWKFCFLIGFSIVILELKTFSIK